MPKTRDVDGISRSRDIPRLSRDQNIPGVKIPGIWLFRNPGIFNPRILNPGKSRNNKSRDFLLPKIPECFKEVPGYPGILFFIGAQKKSFYIPIQICRFPPFFMLLLFTLLSNLKGTRKNKHGNYSQIFTKIVHQKIIIVFEMQYSFCQTLNAIQTNIKESKVFKTINIRLR